MIYRPSETRMANANNLQATDAYYSSKKDLSFKVSSCNLEQLRLQFIKDGGQITKVTQEDIEGRKLPTIRFKRRGWRGGSHTDKANGIKGEVEDELRET